MHLCPAVFPLVLSVLTPSTKTVSHSPCTAQTAAIRASQAWVSLGKWLNYHLPYEPIIYYNLPEIQCSWAILKYVFWSANHISDISYINVSKSYLIQAYCSFCLRNPTQCFIDHGKLIAYDCCQTKRYLYKSFNMHWQHLLLRYHQNYHTYNSTVKNTQHGYHRDACNQILRYHEIASVSHVLAALCPIAISGSTFTNMD